MPKLHAVDDDEAAQVRRALAVAELAEAKRRFRGAIGTLYGLMLLSDRLDATEAIARRWLRETIDELRDLQADHELPRRAS